MIKKIRNTIALLITFSFCVTLSANDTAKTYFPATPDSFWVYEDQDGNEITRRAIEGEEIAGEMYHAFEYEPAFEDWENYEYYIHPTLFKVDETGIKFHIGDEVKKAYKKLLENEIKGSIQQSPPPPEFDFKYDIKVDFELQENFLLLPSEFSLNEEWKSMRIKPTIEITMTFNDSEADKALAGFSHGSKIYFTIMESGIITDKESVETQAGKFDECLKIVYRTETVMPNMPGSNVPAAGESVTTLWLAPNVGIVKFHQESQTPILSEFGNDESTTEVKTLELKKYEIKSEKAKGE